MRYAIYTTPSPHDALTRAAAAWLGRDAFTGAELAQPTLDWLSAQEQAALTADPRRYGFHGTLKAPFALAEGTDVEELEAALAGFAATTAAVELADGLVVAALGPFFALVPASPTPGLDALAADCVRAFEPFRAPPAEADLARRRKSSLTPRQDANVVEWGYPYVFDEFRFHMTLTGPVPEALAAPMRRELETRFAPFTGKPARIDTIALFAEQEPGAPFGVAGLHALGASGAATSGLAAAG